MMMRAPPHGAFGPHQIPFAEVNDPQELQSGNEEDEEEEDVDDDNQSEDASVEDGDEIKDN